MKRLFSVMLVLVLSTMLMAQKAEMLKKFAKEAKVTPAAPILFAEPVTSNENIPNISLVPEKTGAISFIQATTMTNAYGPASRNLHPLQYDPYSNILYLVYRGHAGSGNYAASSGEIWYSYSTDQGATWKRVGAFNPGTTSSGRYPTAAFYNPTKTANAADVGIFTTFPKTTPTPAWSTYGWGFDQGQAGSVLSGNIGPMAGYLLDSQQPCIVSDKAENDGSAYVYWWASKSNESSGDTASVKFWRTKDFQNIEMLEPGSWSSIYFNLNGQIPVGQKVLNGIIYAGFIAPFNKYFIDTTNIGSQKFTTIPSGWYVGYAKSTNNGNHWIAYNQGSKKLEVEAWNVCDPRRIPTLAKYDRLWDWKKGDAYISYTGGMTVDKNGKVHFIIGLTDTIANSGGNLGICAIAEVFETDNNTWDGKVIKEYSTNGQYDSYDTLVTFSYAGLDQTGYQCDIATDKDGEVLVATWVGKGVGTNNYNDIFFSYRRLTDNTWSTPINLTETADEHETIYHLAPVVKSLGNNQYQIFLTYAKPINGYTGDFAGSATAMMVGSYTFTANPVGTENNNVKATSFELLQNYPNPFNPTTRIQFTLPQAMDVTLKVYDVMGKEVATLLNGKASAGLNTVEFNASNLTSGVYFYKLNAGTYTATKKMILTK